MIAALLLALGVHTAEAEERRYALIVGNNRGDIDEQPLQYATRDASRVAEVLKSLGGVGAADAVLLHNPDAEQVVEALDRLSDRIAQEQATGDQSLLYVYYSGHADADDLHLSGSRLSLQTLKDTVEDTPATARVLIIDACRAGAITRLKGGSPITPFEINLINNEERSEGTAIITAAAPGEDAQESMRLQGGVFTHHFLAGLQGAADTSGDHKVTLEESFEYARNRTILATSQAPVVQHPNYQYALRGGQDLILTELDGARRVGLLLLEQAGEYIVFDSRASRVTAEFEATDGGVIALPTGRYVLRQRTPAQVSEADIHIVQGEVTTISGAMLQPLPYGQTARRGDTTEPHRALAVTSGTTAAFPLQAGMSGRVGGFVGLRMDGPALSTDIRVRYTASAGNNDFLDIQQQTLAADAAAFRLWDVRRFAGGAGLRAGAERIAQAFKTTGQAPERTTYTLHISPVARAELALSARLSLSVEAGLSAYILPRDDASPSLTTVPYATLALSVFAF